MHFNGNENKQQLKRFVAFVALVKTYFNVHYNYRHQFIHRPSLYGNTSKKYVKFRQVGKGGFFIMTFRNDMLFHESP